MSSSGFANLPGAVDPGQAQAPMTAETTKPAGKDWSDETALGVVLNDVNSTIAYLQSKQLVPLGVENADELIRAFVRAKQWPDGRPRANLSMHVCLQAIEKIMPALYMSLFGNGKRRPFIVNPTGQTKPEAARANASLLSWAVKQAKTKEEMRLMLKHILSYGFGLGCWGWEVKEQRKAIYKFEGDKKGKPTRTWKIEDIEIPSFECLDPRMFGVDPGLKRQDVQSGAQFVYKQHFTTGYGLDDFRDEPYKNVPSNEELIRILSAKEEPTSDELSSQKRVVWREFQAKLEVEWTGKDPLAQPLELLEYWTKDRHIILLQRKLVILNEENEFGRLPFVSCAFIDVLNSHWGFGIPRLLAGEQRLQTGIAGNWIDSLALVLNPAFQEMKGNSPGTQNIMVSPGKVVTTIGELKPLVIADVTKPAMLGIESSDIRAMEKVGANGGSNMPNQAMRTAEGVQAFAGDVIQRLQYFLEQFINLVYLPTLEAFLMLMKDHLTGEQIQSILTVEEGKAYEGDLTDVYNSEVDVDVIAGANMMARFAAAQLMPMIISLVSAGPVADQLEVAAKKFMYDEFIAEGLDMLGWDVEHLIADMTPEDQQRVQQKNQAAMMMAGKMQLQSQQHKDDLEDIAAKGSVQGGVAVVRQAVKSHTDAALAQIQNSLNPPASQTSVGQ